MKILVVEDENFLRKLYSEELVLGIKGAQVSLAPNGKLALEKLNNDRFDIILTDAKMPEMGGVELAREVRKSSKTIPILLITGFLEDHEAVQQENLFTEILDKPIDFDNLVQSIKSLV
ncbi:MAG: response regulator [Halobacteriovoraceae bacterium]|nr:response regulator [Halobacteriovoraceae bacterium]